MIRALASAFLLAASAASQCGLGRWHAWNYRAYVTQVYPVMWGNQAAALVITTSPFAMAFTFDLGCVPWEDLILVGYAWQYPYNCVPGDMIGISDVNGQPMGIPMQPCSSSGFVVHSLRLSGQPGNQYGAFFFWWDPTWGWVRRNSFPTWTAYVVVPARGWW